MISAKKAQKAQITVYLLLGIILLIIIGLVMYLAVIRVPAPTIPEGAQPVVTFVEQCIRDSAVPAISLLASQGGYIYPPQQSVHITDNVTTHDIAYAHYLGNKTLVSKEAMEQQLATYLTYSVPTCLNNFTSLADNGWNITLLSSLQQPSAQVKVTPSVVSIMYTHSIQVTLQTNNFLLNDFSVELPISLGRLYDAAHYLTELTLAQPNTIDLTKLGELGNVTLIPVTNTTLVYALTANDPSMNLVFMIAVMPKLNQPPQLLLPDTLDLRVGHLFSYTIPYQDDNALDQLVFTADTSMFDVVNNTITFTPEIAGEFRVTITVTDSLHQTASKTVRFIVHE